MSVEVPAADLARTLESYPLAYLISVGDNGRPHVVAVDPVLGDNRFRIATCGRSTRRNVADRPDVTLLWPPVEPGGYALIVDGVVGLLDEGLEITPGRAVLHRSGAAASQSACGSDCRPVELPSAAAQ